ncbi:MAG: glutamine amidotransferase [Terracidiphilus sp.]|jgi:GMP synthase (glutamine-hydrolysing)
MQTPTRHALVLSHVAFEDLGTLDAPLRERGFAIDNILAATARFPLPQADPCDLLIVLGGPIGVYDDQDYPFLKDEIACIRQRLAARQPILGICLGAQLIAAALGARVYPGLNGAEIGWSPLQAASTPPAGLPRWFAPLLAPGLSVFHWHGDTFDLPTGALHLAGTKLYAHQAFALDDFALALQFHPEVTAAGLESWYVGHASELHHAGISASSLRASAQQHSAALENAARRFWGLWLDSIL